MTEPQKKVPFYRNPYVLAFVASAILLPVMRPFLRNIPEPPPVMGQVPSFAFVDQTGKAFGSQELSGQVYVANFIFTRCMTVCPTITRAMASLQERFVNAKVPIRIVSFTVDPEADTPETLRAYGQTAGANFSVWSFLTAPRSEVRQLLEEGFKVPLEDASRAEGGKLIDIAHTKKAAIVDGAGGLRGYYNTDELGIDEIFNRAQHVFEQEKRNK